MGCCSSVQAGVPTVSKVIPGDDKFVAKNTAPANPPPPKPALPHFGVSSMYEVKLALGRGGSGETWLCKEVGTSMPYAIKFIKRGIPANVTKMILHEIQVAADLGRAHRNIVRTQKAVLSKTHLAIVMEFAEGGTLTDYIEKKRRKKAQDKPGLCLEETEARFLFRQFIDAVDVCHQHHVAHRDLKLDNTLLDGSDPPRMKLCDFGFSRNWEGDECHMMTHVGTPAYMSPEMIIAKGSAGKSYDGTKVDIWASGVTLAVMLLGCFPFDHDTHVNPNSSQACFDVWLQQLRGSWRDNPRLQQLSMLLSDDCRDFLDKILTLDEEARLDIKGIRSHAWYNHPLPELYEAALSKLDRDQKRLIVQQPSVDKLKERDAQLSTLVSKASQLGQADEVEVVDLL